MPVPESRATLIAQQRQLIDGDRSVQMFPKGHPELTLPRGMNRLVVKGDVFHFNKKKITPKKIIAASKSGRENELLDLGPVSKNEALERAKNGEHPVAVVERTPDGTETRAAAGTDKTAADQVKAMNRVKSDGNSVAVEHPEHTIANRFADGGPVFDDANPIIPLPSGPSFAPDSKVEPLSAAKPEEQKAAPDNLTDFAKTTVSNIPSSAVQFGHDIIQPFIHPIDTAENIKNLGLGVAEKTGISSGTEHKPYADAVGKFLADRYGSMDAFKNTVANDPVGVAADLSMLFTGGETALARIPGAIGKAGEIAGTVGRTLDPLTAAGKGAKAIGSGAAGVIGGIGTHTGGDTLRLAAKAGYEGGDAARSFQENLRGTAPMEDAVTEARKALGNIREERGNAYRDNMAKVGGDPTILDFDKVDNALASIASVKTYKGQVISPSTQAIRGEIGTAIKDWKALDPAEFHTVEGMDALKQKIGDIRDATQPGTPERVVADRAYHAIRNTIVDQAPEYAKVMKGYEEASKQIKDIEKTLSLNPNASIDTALRKLQSVLRNNVNTNYGRRADLAEYLMKAGAPNLMNKLAGQSLSSWTPRGLGKLGMQLGAEMAALGAGTAAAGATGALAGAALLPFMSPRLMGEGAYYAGKGAANLPIRPAARTSYQLGRDLVPGTP